MRLAVQGHDHEREQLFFKGELLARRWVADKPWHARFWFGLFYQVLADFGRSLLRPFLWLVTGWFMGAWFYLGQHAPKTGSRLSGIDAALRWLNPFGGAAATAQTCDQVVASFGLSLHKTLFAGFGSADKLKQFYACLYGGQAAAPVIPDAVSFAGVAQALYSAVLIFLLLLAVRNHFRIK